MRKGTAPAFSPENIRKAFPLLLTVRRRAAPGCTAAALLPAPCLGVEVRRS